jgi:hypothetical protein
MAAWAAEQDGQNTVKRATSDVLRARCSVSPDEVHARQKEVQMKKALRTILIFIVLLLLFAVTASYALWR